MDRTDAQRKSLLRRVETDLLDEAIKLSFLSASYYYEGIAKGKVTPPQADAIKETQQAVKLILHY